MANPGKHGFYTVGDFMTQKDDLITAKATTTVDEALELLVQNRITGLPVVDEFGKVDCPGDPYFTGRHLELSAELCRLQEMKSEFSHHASVSYWISTADRMNKDFFAIHRERPAGTTMRAIRDAGGALHTDPDQVLATATEFYEDLFTAESLTDDILDARDLVFHTRQSDR
ncbi:hypothetical protein L7F22_029228 [Adiantum nelumboides]|nr:hypothetical protein [Adiantum nelumboides]